jgi:hypothetical protein
MGHDHRGRSQRSGAGGHDSPMTRLVWGRGQGHEGGGRGASGKMRNGVAHRGGRASVRCTGRGRHGGIPTAEDGS